MLVLTRKLMEKLYIGDDVCVTIVRIEGGQVRLGIEAPREIPVIRAELVAIPEPAEEMGPYRGPTTLEPASTEIRGRIRIRPTLVHGSDSRFRGRSQ